MYNAGLLTGRGTSFYAQSACPPRNPHPVGGVLCPACAADPGLCPRRRAGRTPTTLLSRDRPAISRRHEASSSQPEMAGRTPDGRYHLCRRAERPLVGIGLGQGTLVLVRLGGLQE